MTRKRDHGGGIDAARAQYGGARKDWLDLSTGINPVPYPIGDISAEAWGVLPDKGAFEALESAARSFWNIPDEAAVLAAPGASALIARLPALHPVGRVQIEGPTYNEHRAAYEIAGWDVTDAPAPARTIVSPNNPTGSYWDGENRADFMVIDESFCDLTPERSHVARAAEPGVVILKSFGKFWGLAGARLGFAIGDPALIHALKEALGPWQVSGPTLQIGTRALQDTNWAEDTRARLATDATRLDAMITAKGATCLGGTDLFRLYDVDDAQAWQDRLAQHHIWSRIFPYSKTWLRLGLPAPHQWTQLETAL